MRGGRDTEVAAVTRHVLQGVGGGPGRLQLEEEAVAVLTAVSARRARAAGLLLLAGTALVGCGGGSDGSARSTATAPGSSAAALVREWRPLAAFLTEDCRRRLFDADGETLGRLATRIADTLRGKRKPVYTPHVDTGDFVVVVNCERIRVTGNKLQEKRYYRHSGYPGGLRERTLAEQLERRPEEVIRRAVRGMLPKNRLGRAQLTKLKVYRGAEHPHVAQQPQQLP